MAQVHNCNALAKILQIDNELDPELNMRKREGQIIFGKISSTFNDPEILPEIKHYLFKVSILPVIPYDCKSWNTTTSKDSKLWAIQRATEKNTKAVNWLEHIMAQSGLERIIAEMCDQRRR